MAQRPPPLSAFFKGWEVYQQRLVTTVAALTPEQLALRAAPNVFSIGKVARHIIAMRVGWFHLLMGEGSPDLVPMWHWDGPEQPERSPAELAAGLEVTGTMIQDALSRWTPADLNKEFQDWYPWEEYRGDEPWYSRQWVIWHIVEHDLHHGGELSLTLGMHGMPAAIID